MTSRARRVQLCAAQQITGASAFILSAAQSDFCLFSAILLFEALKAPRTWLRVPRKENQPAAGDRKKCQKTEMIVWRILKTGMIKAFLLLFAC